MEQYPDQDCICCEVADYLTEIVCRIQADGKITYANRAFLIFFEKDIQNLVGNPIQDLFPLEDNEDFFSQLNQIFSGQKGQEERVIRRCYRGDGQISWQEWTYRLIPARPNHEQEIQFAGRDITNYIKLYDELGYMCTHDTLTGIYNRSYLQAEIQRLERSRKYPISIFFIDVDRMKQINDTLGHITGDQVLISTAKLIRECLRPEDVVARVGGDEFVVVLPDTSPEAANKIQARIRMRVNQFIQNGYQYSLSIGTATAMPGDSLMETFNKADQSMYHDKSSKPHRKSPGNFYDPTAKQWVPDYTLQTHNNNLLNPDKYVNFFSLSDCHKVPEFGDVEFR